MSISSKIIITVGFVGMMATSIFVYLNLKSHRKDLITQIENSSLQLSETIKRSTGHDMLAHQRRSIKLVIDTIGKQEGINKVRIFNRDGKIIFSSFREEVGKKVNKKAESCLMCHSGIKPLDKLPNQKRMRTFINERGE